MMTQSTPWFRWPPPLTGWRVVTVVTAVIAAALPSAATAQATSATAVLTLTEAATSALETHPLLAGSAARTRAAEASLDGARAARLPTLQLQAGLTRFQEPMIVAPLHALDPTNPPRFDETLVQGRLGTDYTLFDGGARGDRIRGAEAIAESTGHAREQAQMMVLSEVASAYVGLASRRAVRDAALAWVEALTAELERAQRQVDAGTAARVQLLRASAALQDARARLVGAESGVGLAERNLARIMGVAFDVIAGRPLLDVAPAGATEPPDDVLPPAVAAADRRVEALAATLSAERATRLPRLDATAALLDFGTPTGEHVLEWQAGVRFSWAVFNGGARRAAIRRAEAELAEARASAEMARLSVGQAVDAAGTAVAGAEALAEALEAAVLQWAEVARIEALALESGAGVQSDLLRAQANLFQATAGLAEARGDAALARVELARARGVLNMEWINQQLENPR